MTPIFIPMTVKSEANQRGHWAARHRRGNEQRQRVGLYLLALNHHKAKLAEGCIVHLRRIYAGKGKPMDSDNLHGAFKAVRDAIATWLGRKDDPTSPVQFAMPTQERGRASGIEIRFEQNGKE